MLFCSNQCHNHQFNYDVKRQAAPLYKRMGKTCRHLVFLYQARCWSLGIGCHIDTLRSDIAILRHVILYAVFLYDFAALVVNNLLVSN